MSLISEYNLNVEEMEIRGKSAHAFELLGHMFLTLVVNNINCKVLPLQRKTVVFGTLYNISLADQSCITQSHVCVTTQCTGWLPFVFLFCWVPYFFCYVRHGGSTARHYKYFCCHSKEKTLWHYN